MAVGLRYDTTHFEELLNDVKFTRTIRLEKWKKGVCKHKGLLLRLRIEQVMVN
jgi:hypothetical protein